MPARPTPSFFSAARRVTDWAMPLVSSSNWLFIFFFLGLSVVVVGFVIPRSRLKCGLVCRTGNESALKAIGVRVSGAEFCELNLQLEAFVRASAIELDRAGAD